MTRKLDALVAEKVMGLVYKLGQPIYSSGPKCHGWGLPKNSWINLRLPAYSTDIAAAWMVVEKLVSTGLNGGIEFWNYPQPWVGPEGRWVAHFFSSPDAEPSLWSPDKETGDTGIEGIAEDSSVPLAICLAALKAVGVDQGVIGEALKLGS